MHHHAIAKITHSVQRLMERACALLDSRVKVAKSSVLMGPMGKTVSLNVNVKMEPNVIQKLGNVFVVRDGTVSNAIVHAIKNDSEPTAMKPVTVSIVVHAILKLVLTFLF